MSGCRRMSRFIVPENRLHVAQIYVEDYGLRMARHLYCRESYVQRREENICLVAAIGAIWRLETAFYRVLWEGKDSIHFL